MLVICTSALQYYDQINKFCVLYVASIIKKNLMAFFTQGKKVSINISD